MSQQVKANPLARVDWILLALVLMLASVGLLNLYSSSIALGERLYITQSVWILLGMGLVAAVASVDYRLYERWAYVIYIGVVGLLLLVMGAGSTLNGAKRWLNLGFFMLQPSELMKLAIILATARYFADRPHLDGNSLLDLGKPLIMLALPCILIMLQPDLGTALVVVFIFFTIVLFEGVKLRSLLIMGLVGLVSAPFAWVFVLKDYQKQRILSFLDLEKDPYGPGWQVRQSLIAFGSGGMSGKGYLEGTQVQMGFVPYHESDFAAVNWAEEHGFIGMIILLGLYIALIGWSIHISRSSRDRFGMLTAVGVGALVFWHVIINLGMVLGMLPVVGLTLPLVSYGGSSVLTIMLGMGLLMNVSVRRHLLRR